MRTLLTGTAVVILACAAVFLMTTRIPEGSIGVAGRGADAHALQPGLHLHSPLAGPVSFYSSQPQTWAGNYSVQASDGAEYVVGYEVAGRLDPSRVLDFHRALAGGGPAGIVDGAAGEAIDKTLNRGDPALLALPTSETEVTKKTQAILAPDGVVDVSVHLTLSPPTLLKLAHSLALHGKASVLRQRAEEAVRTAAKGSWELYTALGIVLESSADLQGAEKSYLDALSVNPTAMPPMSQIYTLYSGMGRNEDLDRLLQAALQVNPKSVQHLTWLSASLLRQNKPAEALKPAQDALALEPANLQLLNNVAGIYLKLGRYDDATRTLQTAVASAPEDRLSLFNLGQALCAQHKFKEGLKALLDAEKAGKAGAPLLGAIAQTYRHLGETSRARAYEKRAKEAAKAAQAQKKAPAAGGS